MKKPLLRVLIIVYWSILGLFGLCALGTQVGTWLLTQADFTPGPQSLSLDIFFLVIVPASILYLVELFITRGEKHD